MTTSPHVHASALRALVNACHLSKQEIAVLAGMTPGQLSDLLSARRSGRSTDVRARLAHALNVPVSAITCPCEAHSGEMAA